MSSESMPPAEGDESPENLAERELQEQLVRLQTNTEALAAETPQNPTERINTKVKEFWDFLEKNEALTKKLSYFVGGSISGLAASGGSMGGFLAGAGIGSALEIGGELLDKYLRQKWSKERDRK